MQVSQIPILKFLKTANSLVIPVYQRDYAWKVDNCKKLWQDLLDLQSSNRMSHFLGTLVTINSGVGNYLVIDGQQRLTTVSIFILALKTVIKNKSQPTEEESRLEKVLEGYLIDEESLSQNTRIKLKPNKSDNIYFQELFNEKYSLSLDSNIFLNFQYFVEVLTSQPDLVTIFESIKKLEIVSINLIQNQDDPQLIFESLNSTGVDLTDGDLIRNYILMDLETDFQEKLYTDYWLKIENFSAGNTAEFIRNFLMFRLASNVTQTKRAVYTEFKKYAEEKFNKDSQKVLTQIVEYAQIYSYFIRQNQHPEAIIDNQLERLDKLEFKVAYPFLFEIFDLLNQGILDKQTVAKIIQLIESYAFRKILVDNTTQGLNKLFFILSKEVKKLDPENWQNNYFEILSFILKSKAASQKFPTDEDFIEALCTKEIYKLRSKNRDFLLEGLESYNSAYKVDFEDLTIEHILPQNASKWKKSLGENWQEIRDKYIHTLGNLTLTAQNSKLSNKAFADKKAIDYQTSKLKLSYKLGDMEEWNEDTILQRSKELAAEAVEIWKYPSSNFIKEVEEKEVYSLEEEVDFKGKKIKKIIIQSQEFTVKNWWFAVQALCNFLYAQSPTEFKQIISNSEISKEFSQDPNKINGPMEILNSWYVDCGKNTNRNVRLMSKLCDLLNFDKSEVEVEVK